jgi:uncharacterized delta-60 repeat protein
MAGRVTRNGQIVSDGLVWSVNANNRNSYPRRGATAWNDLSDFQTPGFIANGPTFNDSGSFNYIRTDGANDIIYPQITGTTKIPGFRWGLHWDLDWTIEVWITPTRYAATSYAYFYAQYNGSAAPTYPSCASLIFTDLTTNSARAYFNPSVNDGAVFNNGLTFLRFNTRSMQHITFTMRDGTEFKTYLSGSLAATGTYDFKNTGFGRVNAVETIQVDSQGKIWCGGTFARYNDQYITYGLIRLNPDGTIVSNWNTGSSAINPLANVGLTGCNHRITQIELTGSQANIFGTFNQYKNATRQCGARVDATGSLSTGNPLFNYGIIGRTNSAGKIYMGVKFSSAQSMLSFFSRRQPDMSTFDPGFISGSSTNSNITALELDANEKPIIGGTFSSYSGSAVARIARINTNGTLDTTFNVGAGANNTVWTIATGSGNSIYIGGEFTLYSGSAVNRITKINSNGTRDTSFNVGTGFNSIVDFITTDSTGKVYVGGQFTTYSGSSTPYFVRLNTNGTIDTTFNAGTGFDRPVKAIAIAADNKIYAGGQFFNYSGSSANGIVSLNMDGTINTTFNYGTGFSRANDRPSQFTPTFAGNVIGYMDANWGEIRIYNKALTAAEVLSNYNGSKGKYGL